MLHEIHLNRRYSSRYVYGPHYRNIIMHSNTQVTKHNSILARLVNCIIEAILCSLENHTVQEDQGVKPGCVIEKRKASFQ